MVQVAYITSGKIGIHRFTYNELVELEKQNIEFVLCLTQLKKGLWMPKPEWIICKGSPVKAILSFMCLLFTKPRLLFILTHIANHSKVIPYFFISLSLYFDLRRKKVTSLHCQMGDKKIYIGVFLKKLLNKPLTATIHAHELYQREVYDNNEHIKWLFSNCDHIITISEFNAGILRDQFAIPANKLSIIRLFPDIDPLGFLLNKKKILIVANWAEKKGYGALVEAVSKMNRNDFIIIVVGGCYLSANSIDLKKLIKEKCVMDKFLLLGRQGGYDLELIYSSCDIFCLPSFTEYYADGNPSEREGIPVALMEAMAWGKPVVSTRHAGIPELVEDVLVDEGDALQLKDAIEYLLNNSQVWNEMGLRNQEIIRKKYTRENVTILSNLFKSFT